MVTCCRQDVKTERHCIGWIIGIALKRPLSWLNKCACLHWPMCMHIYAQLHTYVHALPIYIELPLVNLTTVASRMSEWENHNCWQKQVFFSLSSCLAMVRQWANINNFFYCADLCCILKFSSLCFLIILIYHDNLWCELIREIF